jgi:hypothetical protein
MLGGSMDKIKGEFEGLCNRKACQTPENVVYYNTSTRMYYCPRCADLINEGSQQMVGKDICLQVPDKEVAQKIEEDVIEMYKY